MRLPLRAATAAVLAALGLTACGTPAAAGHAPSLTPHPVSASPPPTHQPTHPFPSTGSVPPAAEPGTAWVPAAQPPATFHLSPRLSAAASLRATARAMGFPTTGPFPPLAVVPDPAHPAVRWAFSVGPWPTPFFDAPAWFGQRAPGRAWRWTPVYPQRVVPPTLPFPVRASWAFFQNLHQGYPVPSVTTNRLTTQQFVGRVDWPVGWTARVLAGSLWLTTWAPLQSPPAGRTIFVGFTTRWTAHNVATGTASLSGWSEVAAPAGTPLAQALPPGLLPPPSGAS